MSWTAKNCWTLTLLIIGATCFLLMLISMALVLANLANADYGETADVTANYPVARFSAIIGGIGFIFWMWAAAIAILTTEFGGRSWWRPALIIFSAAALVIGANCFTWLPEVRDVLDQAWQDDDLATYDWALGGSGIVGGVVLLAWVLLGGRHYMLTHCNEL